MSSVRDIGLPLPFMLMQVEDVISPKRVIPALDSYHQNMYDISKTEEFFSLCAFVKRVIRNQEQISPQRRQKKIWQHVLYIHTPKLRTMFCFYIHFNHCMEKLETLHVFFRFALILVYPPPNVYSCTLIFFRFP